MADKINKVRNPLEVVKLEEFTVGASEVKIPVDFPDERTVFVVEVTDEGPVKFTIKAGNGYAGTKDEVLELQQGNSAFYIDSARFKVASGADKGTITVKADKESNKLYVIALGTAADQEEPVYV